MHPAARAFGGVAELYERARPGYPDDAVGYLREALALAPGRVVADLGAGTGKLTRRLLESGARVLAVEPLAELRAVLVREAPGAEALAGVAEQLPLPAASIDAVTAGQAFHWFDPAATLAEIARVLRPDGSLGLIWNVRDLADPLQQRVEELLAPHRAGVPRHRDDAWRGELDASPRFQAEEPRAFPWRDEVGGEAFADRVASVSVVASLALGERDALLDEVRGLAAALGERFALAYRAEVYVYRFRG